MSTLPPWLLGICDICVTRKIYIGNLHLFMVEKELSGGGDAFSVILRCVRNAFFRCTKIPLLSSENSGI